MNTASNMLFTFVIGQVICICPAALDVLLAGWAETQATPPQLYQQTCPQAFSSMLCAFKWGVWLFFAGLVAIMTAFVILLMPETRGISLEETFRAFQVSPYIFAC